MAYLYINAFFNFVIMTLNMIITKLMNNIGYYEIEWYPDVSISSGLYIVQIQTGISLFNHKILYLK